MPQRKHLNSWVTMKHSNISIFVPHIGCPHICSFCDQRTISGAQSAPTAEDVRRTCEQALAEIREPQDTEIAFFGGSFTAIPRRYMLELLEAAESFVGEGKFRGIRLSTRPDYIDDEVLSILNEHGVTSIELGAQSMDDVVLTANERGHSAEEVRRASALIRSYGFELGLQMMTGLYMSSLGSDMATAREIVRIKPDTVRIYPVVVLKGTRLGELYESGEYEMPPFDDMVKLCAELIMLFYENGIRVIKCGLHASDGVDGERVAGYYHPAFRELCDMYIYRDRIEKLIADCTDTEVRISVNDRCISRAVGQKKANIEYFRGRGKKVMIEGDSSLRIYECRFRR